MSWHVTDTLRNAYHSVSCSRETDKIEQGPDKKTSLKLVCTGEKPRKVNLDRMPRLFTGAYEEGW